MQDEDDRSTIEMLPIEHTPVMAPRKGVDGEHAYLELWQRYVSRCDEEELEELFRNCLVPWPNQRAATVAASFVMWLGTSCGGGLLRTVEGQVMRGGFSDPDTRYLRAWESENRRRGSINGGVRSVEVILSPDLHVTQRSAPTVTVADLDVIECVCMWLPTPDGQAFIRAADARLTAIQRERHLFGEVAHA